MEIRKKKELKVLFVAFDATTAHLKRLARQEFEKQFGTTIREDLISLEKIQKFLKDKNFKKLLRTELDKLLVNRVLSARMCAFE